MRYPSFWISFSCRIAFSAKGNLDKLRPPEPVAAALATAPQAFAFEFWLGAIFAIFKAGVLAFCTMTKATKAVTKATVAEN